MTHCARCCALVFVLLTGCTLTQLTPQARLQESVYTLNDAARWNQVDIATRTVSPKYKLSFQKRRQGWGESVNVAEVDVLYQALAPDKESAISEISLSWTDATGVMLHKSYLTQTWANEHGYFKLIDERIKKGDPGIFYVEADPQD
jgi:hypothetical protein